MATKDFNTEHLSGEAKTVANGIVEWMATRYGSAPDGGGCKAFYSAKEWKERGESYGTNALLVLVHDGGDLAPLCNWDYECYKQMDEFGKYLREKHEVYVEGCTSWYSAVYKV